MNIKSNYVIADPDIVITEQLKKFKVLYVIPVIMFFVFMFQSTEPFGQRLFLAVFGAAFFVPIPAIVLCIISSSLMKKGKKIQFAFNADMDKDEFVRAAAEPLKQIFGADICREKGTVIIGKGNYYYITFGVLYITLNAIDDYMTLSFGVTGRDIKNYRAYMQAYDEYRRVFYPMAYLLQNISYGNDVSDKFAALKKNSIAKSPEPADRPVKLYKSSDAAHFCPKCGNKLDANSSFCGKCGNKIL
ncbi:MAG: zinc ribbon domain-containing protein [Oscillospiraceae bacterium]